VPAGFFQIVTVYDVRLLNSSSVHKHQVGLRCHLAGSHLHPVTPGRVVSTCVAKFGQLAIQNLPIHLKELGVLRTPPFFFDLRLRMVLLWDPEPPDPDGQVLSAFLLVSQEKPSWDQPQAHSLSTAASRPLVPLLEQLPAQLTVCDTPTTTNPRTPSCRSGEVACQDIACALLLASNKDVLCVPAMASQERSSTRPQIQSPWFSNPISRPLVPLQEQLPTQLTVCDTPTTTNPRTPLCRFGEVAVEVNTCALLVEPKTKPPVVAVDHVSCALLCPLLATQLQTAWCEAVATW